MKGTGLRLVAVVVFLLVFAGANVGAFLLGRASVEYKVSWEDTQVFYAEILERRENSFLVEGPFCQRRKPPGAVHFCRGGGHPPAVERRGDLPGGPSAGPESGDYLFWR